jgi:hypothetical protein
MPPYIPLPYASDQPAYSNRDYTLKQMQLLEQQAAREAAYERERGTMMAGRWAGLGGLATETLGSLVQARDLRAAKALEQARYDTQQARIASQDARIAEEDRVAAAERLYQQQQRRAVQIKERAGVGGTLTDEQAAEMEAANPGSTEQFRIAPQSMTTLSSLARPEDPGRAFRSLDFSGGVPEKRTLFNSRPDFTGRFGEELVEGTTMTPEVSGVRMRMTGPQGKELSKEIVRDSALQSLIDSRDFTPQQVAILRANPDLPPQAWAELFPPAVKTTQTPPSTYEAAAVRADLAGRPEDAAYFRKLDLTQRAAGRAPSTTDDASANVKEMVTGMINGTVPPVLPGRASPLYVQIVAEANRRGFNLTSAAQDWQATSRTLTTMNGPQQLRLRQSIGALPGMLDEVEKFAKQWKAGKFPPLNAAQLALAQNGALGTSAATIAASLEAQIADVVADLGNVYMGGNSPTDHALELAGKSLKANWDEKVLLRMIDLARRNVKIRQNSMANVGVAGASVNNPYAPTVPPTETDTTGWSTTPDGTRFRVKPTR